MSQRKQKTRTRLNVSRWVQWSSQSSDPESSGELKEHQMSIGRWATWMEKQMFSETLSIESLADRVVMQMTLCYFQHFLPKKEKSPVLIFKMCQKSKRLSLVTKSDRFGSDSRFFTSFLSAFVSIFFRLCFFLRLILFFIRVPFVKCNICL